MTHRLLLVVGLQKSGTTLLGRLVERSSAVARVDRGEGDAYWGNDPPFSPTASPAGVLYQRHGGERGHELDASDVTPAIAAELHGRLPAINAPLHFNKSPYNTVRLPWLRAIFPDAFIVAMVRRPIPNVYSLGKKFIPHEGRGRGPEDGWWGVKPAGWRSMRDPDPRVQCARQWRAVNARLVAHRGFLDEIVAYDALCRDPDGIVGGLLERAVGTPVDLGDPAPPLHCADDEVEHGARLRSRNRTFRDHGTLESAPPDAASAELPPLDATDAALIADHCRDVAAALGMPA